MATSVRVVYNRNVADQLRLGLADGLYAIVEAIVRRARPPSDVGTETAGEFVEEQVENRPPLIHNGGALAWIDGKKIAGFGLDGRQPTKPRGVKLPQPGIVAVGGFGFPGHFAERGTIHEAARPFLTPAMVEVLPEAEQYLRPAVRARLGQR